jgi:adenylate kinase
MKQEVFDEFNSLRPSRGRERHSGTEDGRALSHSSDLHRGYQGQLVPDALVIGIIEERLKAADCNPGFILDGFPRTIAQAEALQPILTKMGKSIDHVINIEVDPEELIRRLTGRRTCKNCGAMFHILFQPPKREGICDRCGGTLYQREDDKEETIRTRLNEYQKQTAPLIQYYRHKKMLRSIQGVGGQDQIFEQIVRLLDVTPR